MTRPSDRALRTCLRKAAMDQPDCLPNIVMSTKRRLLEENMQHLNAALHARTGYRYGFLSR